MMRRDHLFLRSLVMAAVFPLMMALWGTPGLMQRASLVSPDRRLLAFAGMAALGACVAAAPGRMRRREVRRSTWQGCAAAFAGGLLAVLGLGLADAGDLALLCGTMQGGLGALAFMGCAGLTAALTMGVMSRWRK